MKRTLAFVLSLVLILSLLPVSVFAADSIELTLGEASGTAGEDVTIPLTINEDFPTVTGITLVVSYNTDMLTLKSIDDSYYSAAAEEDLTYLKKGSLTSNTQAEGNVGKLTFSHETGLVLRKAPTMCTLTFTIKSDAENGTFPITLTCQKCSNSGVDISTTLHNGSIAVSGALPTITTMTLKASDKTTTVTSPAPVVNGTGDVVYWASAASAKGTDLTKLVNWTVKKVVDTALTDTTDVTVVKTGDDTGKITVAAKAAEGTYRVTAEPVSGSSKNEGEPVKVDIVVTRAGSAPETVAVGGGQASIIVPVPSAAAATSAAFTAAVTDQFGDTMQGEGAAVTWSIAPEKTGVSIDDSTGVVTVTAAAKANITNDTGVEFTVTAATSNSKTGTAKITVKRAAPVVESVTVGGGQASIEIPTGEAVQSSAFTAAVVDQYAGGYDGAVAWSIAPAKTGVSIDPSTGVVTVTAAAKADIADTDGVDFTVTAAVGGKTGTATIKVKRAASVVSSVEIAGTPSATIAKPTSGSATVTYTATVKDQYGAAMTEETVDWENTSTLSDVTVSGAAVTVSAGSALGQFTLTAKAHNDPSKTDSITVKIVDVSFTVGEDAADANNAVTVKATPTYGDQFTGNAPIITVKSSAITVKVGDRTLTGGTYAVVPTSTDTYPAAGAQTYKVTYTNEAEHYADVTVFEGATVTLAPKAVTVTVADATRAYGAGAAEYSARVTGGSLVGEQTVDDLSLVYTCTQNGTDTAAVGKYDITAAAGNSNYDVTVNKGTLTITAKSIADESVSVASIETQTFTGAALTPDVTVTDTKPSATLAKGTDYTVAYSANTNAGTATVTITGQGNYTGSTTAQFTIAPRAIDASGIEFDALDAVTYTGSAFTPAVTGKDGETALRSGVDFKAAYANNTNAGTADVTVTGQGNYTGSKTLHFTINKKSISDCTVNVTGGLKVGDVMTASIVGVIDAPNQVNYGWALDLGTDEAETAAAMPMDMSPQHFGDHYYFVFQPVQSFSIYWDMAGADNLVCIVQGLDLNYTGYVVTEKMTIASYELTGTLSVSKSTDEAITADDTVTLTLSTALSGLDLTFFDLKINDETVEDFAPAENDMTATCTIPSDATGSVTITLVPKSECFTGTISTTVELGKKTLPTSGWSVTPAAAAPAVDEELTLTAPDSLTKGDYTVQWMADDAPIAGATDTTFTVTAAQRGKTLSVKITGAGDTYTGECVCAVGSDPVPATVPGTVTVRATGSDGKVALSWSAPADNGGATITAYIVYYGAAEAFDMDDSSTYTAVTMGNVTSYEVLGLTNDTEYAFVVLARNSMGTSAAGEPVTATPKATVYNPSAGDPAGTVTNPDGSKTTTETKADGTVLETTVDTDGTKTVVTTNPDGSATATVSQPNGVKAEATTTVAGATTATVTVPASVDTAKVTIPVKNAEHGMVPVKVNADGTEEVIKWSAVTDRGVAFQVDESAEIKFVDNSKSFNDVPAGAWYEDHVDFVSSHGLFSGVSNTQFAPATNMTRGMLVTVLFRLDGEIKGDAGSGFTDVAATAWHADAVEWAAANNVVTGYGDGTFGPNDNVTREQLCAILYRYAKSAGLKTVGSGSVSNYSDADAVSDYAAAAVAWAVGCGIVTGYPDGTLSPEGHANRAEVATMLERFVAYFVK